MKEIQRLQPFGQGNEEPVFYARAPMGGYGAQIVGNSHLRITLSHPRGTITAIGFGQGEKLTSLNGDRADLVFTCHYNEYRGQRTIDLHLKDIRPVAAQAAATLPNTVQPPKPSTAQLNVQTKSNALTPAPTITSPGFQWKRENLGRIYTYLKNAANERRQVDLQNSYLFAQKEKITKEEFDTVLTVFIELNFFSIQNGFIQFHTSPQKRDLNESATFRSVLAQTTSMEQHS